MGVEIMSKRNSIYVEEFAHKNPVPAACRIGNLIYSGGIHGLDPKTGQTAETLPEQLSLVFRHVQTIVEAGGGSVDDIIKMTFWMCDRADRPLLNVEWEKMFPDQEDRPSRHVMRGNLDGAMLVQCDFVALIS